MYKIAILGCENTHANSFLRQIYKKGRHTDIEVIGIYSDEAISGRTDVRPEFQRMIIDAQKKQETLKAFMLKAEVKALEKKLNAE